MDEFVNRFVLIIFILMGGFMVIKNRTWANGAMHNHRLFKPKWLGESTAETEARWFTFYRVLGVTAGLGFLLVGVLFSFGYVSFTK